MTTAKAPASRPSSAAAARYDPASVYAPSVAVAARRSKDVARSKDGVRKSADVRRSGGAKRPPSAGAVAADKASLAADKAALAAANNVSNELLTAQQLCALSIDNLFTASSNGDVMPIDVLLDDALLDDVIRDDVIFAGLGATSSGADRA